MDFKALNESILFKGSICLFAILAVACSSTRGRKPPVTTGLGPTFSREQIEILETVEGVGGGTRIFGILIGERQFGYISGSSGQRGKPTLRPVGIPLLLFGPPGLFGYHGVNVRGT